MLSGLTLHPDEVTGQAIAEQAGVGVCTRFHTQQLFSNSKLLLACDAELYNEKELRDFIKAGADPSATGTAVLLAGLYEQLGSAFVEKLRGIFSFVLWDRAGRRLVAAVDGFGIKRLTYYQNPQILLIATRIDALTRTGQTQRAINPQAVATYVNFGVNLAPETTLAGVLRIEPGTMLLADARGTRVEKYWDMRYGQGNESRRKLSDQLQQVMTESVAAHCNGDSFRNLGASLSGGVDSSTVVGLMSRMGQGPVNAFSIGFEDEHFNELEYARIAARGFKANHQTYLVSAADCVEALPRMIRAFDEPFGNSSAIPTYFCARLAAQSNIHTLMAGDGGDELFGGNERYRTDKIFELYQQVPRILRNGLIEPSLALLPFQNGVAGLARKYVRRSNIPNPQRFYSYDFLSSHAVGDIFEPDFIGSLQGHSFLERPCRHYQTASATTHLDRLLYLDVKMTLGDSDLPKVTCMSELAGVKTRFPYLDRSVAEFSGRVPASLKLRGLKGRYLFKQTFSGLLPAEIIKKKKHGFGIPVSRWLRTYAPLREQAHDVLLSNRAFERGYFRRSFIENLFHMFEKDESTYYGDTLWSFLVLELWHREFVDQPVRAAA